MMSSNRSDYASSHEWLTVVRQDEAWLTLLARLETTVHVQGDALGDSSQLREEAMRRIGQGEAFEFWDIYQHDVEKAVSEVWLLQELSLVKLKIHTIGMLTIEWLEQHNVTDCDVANLITPMFYNDREKAANFVKQIQNMKPTQITALVNQLVAEKKLSDMSCHRDLWRVLHDNELYTPSESNWNMQVK